MGKTVEYIIKERAKELVCDFCAWAGTSNCEECEHPIDDVPSADVVPVVRCRDCEIQQYCNIAQYLGMDGFCSNGAKMDGGK